MNVCDYEEGFNSAKRLYDSMIDTRLSHVALQVLNNAYNSLQQLDDPQFLQGFHQFLKVYSLKNAGIIANIDNLAQCSIVETVDSEFCPHCNSEMESVYLRSSFFALDENALMPFEEVEQQCSNPQCVSNQTMENPF